MVGTTKQIIKRLNKKRKKPLPQDTLVVRTNALPLSELSSRFLPPRPDICFTVDGNEYEVDLQTSSSIRDDNFDACFKMLEESLEGLYKSSEWGWSEKKKKKEMKHPAMRYLLLRCKNAPRSVTASVKADEGDEEETNGASDTSTGELAGFLSFMITEEHVWEVIYIYEVNVLPSHQSRGLGKKLIGVMEHFGRAVGVEKAMLTVFYSNKRAKALYVKIGYSIDAEWSPEPKRLRSGEIKDSSYMILSKEFNRSESKEELN